LDLDPSLVALPYLLLETCKIQEFQIFS